MAADGPSTRPNGCEPPPAAAGCSGRSAGVGALGLLAGCENTTTPIGACESGDGSSNLVVAEADRARRPAAAAPRQLRHLGDHGGQPADRRRRRRREGPARDLQLRRLPRPEPRSRSSRSCTGRKVQIATYNSADEAIAKLSSGAVAFDLIIGPLGLQHRQPDRAAADPAAQPLVPAELREEHLARAAGPVLRPRQPLHGAVRRLVGRDRLAQRQDRRTTSPR